MNTIALSALLLCGVCFCGAAQNFVPPTLAVDGSTAGSVTFTITGQESGTTVWWATISDSCHITNGARTFTLAEVASCANDGTYPIADHVYVLTNADTTPVVYRIWLVKIALLAGDAVIEVTEVDGDVITPTIELPMVATAKTSDAYDTDAAKPLEAQPGDVLFFNVQGVCVLGITSSDILLEKSDGTVLLSLKQQRAGETAVTGPPNCGYNIQVRLIVPKDIVDSATAGDHDLTLRFMSAVNIGRRRGVHEAKIRSDTIVPIHIVPKPAQLSVASRAAGVASVLVAALWALL